MQETSIPVCELPRQKTVRHQCIEFLHYPMYSFFRPAVHEARDKCAEDCCHKNGRPCKGKGPVQLLPIGEKLLRHTLLCKREHQALVQDEASCLPSILP